MKKRSRPNIFDDEKLDEMVRQCRVSEQASAHWMASRFLAVRQELSQRLNKNHDSSANGSTEYAGREFPVLTTVYSTGPLCPGMVVSARSDRPDRLCVAMTQLDGSVVGVIVGSESNISPIEENVYLVPVATTGLACCLVDANIAAVLPGDRLTTSAKPGYAMNMKGQATEKATIGTAMSALRSGTGLVVVELLRHDSNSA